MQFSEWFRMQFFMCMKNVFEENGMRDGETEKESENMQSELVSILKFLFQRKKKHFVNFYRVNLSLNSFPSS